MSIQAYADSIPERRALDSVLRDAILGFQVAPKWVRMLAPVWIPVTIMWYEQMFS